MSSQKRLYMNVYSSLICNNQILETICHSRSEWVDWYIFIQWNTTLQ